VKTVFVCAMRDARRAAEIVDAIPEGETPHTVILFNYDDLVDVARPGDRVEITGIFRAEPLRVNPLHRTVKSVYKVRL
jgi:DNA replication licensing factor MCM4